MGKTLRKAQAAQHARIKDWTATIARIDNQPNGNSKGYRKPGSMKK